MTVNGKLKHFCSGAVVQSPHKDLVITAAHCLDGKRLGESGNVTFAPNYHAGIFPGGRWIVRSEFVDTAWTEHRNPNDDFAFIIVGKPNQQIQKGTGGEVVKTNVSLPQNVQVIGYPDAANLPVECRAPATALDRAGYQQLVFDCDGYTGGTSGGPFLMNVNHTTGLGELIGVIGGFQLGGDSPNISYASEFLSNLASLYKKAIS
jgi:V8-like Glu-specific endopeptidase